jgi:SAM-dependent methyltransferase
METDWFKSYFDDSYEDYILGEIPQDLTEQQVRLIEDILDLKAGSKILDLFCGVGRHSIALAERGYNVTAIDYSLPYIEKLKNRAVELNLSINALSLDAREINFREEFDSIILMFVSFGYFCDCENEELLKKLSKALKSGGKVLIDLENRDYILKHFIKEKWREKDYGLLLERHKFDPLSSRQKTKRVIILNSGEKKETFRDIRLYSAHELISIANNANLKVDKLYGDYDKTPFHLNAPRLLFSFVKS